MTLVMARASLAKALLVVFSEDLYNGEVNLDALSPHDIEMCRTGRALPKNDCGLYSVFRSFELSGDEAFVRLAMEQLIKSGTDRDYSPLMIEFHDKEDAEPVLRQLYQIIWGDLPDGPAPEIEYFNVGFANDPVQRMAAWQAERNARYGVPPYDFDQLRAVALEPGTPVFPVTGRGWTAEPYGDGYSLTYLSGAHVPQEVTVQASVADIKALENGAKFNDIVTPLVRAQKVKIM